MIGNSPRRLGCSLTDDELPHPIRIVDTARQSLVGANVVYTNDQGLLLAVAL